MLLSFSMRNFLLSRCNYISHLIRKVLIFAYYRYTLFFLPLHNFVLQAALSLSFLYLRNQTGKITHFRKISNCDPICLLITYLRLDHINCAGISAWSNSDNGTFRTCFVISILDFHKLNLTAERNMFYNRDT